MPVKTPPSLARRGDPLAAPAHQREILEQRNGIPHFDDRLAKSALPQLETSTIEVLQLNVGKLCNQTCRHCHVDAGPDRTEVMSRETADACLRVLAASTIPTVDITGGAPELAPVFRHLVREARSLDRRVIDRCNLTVLELPSQADLVDFLAAHDVEVVASLPHYMARDTDRQRGDGVFERSLAALRRLNAAGYGRDGRHRLHLVYNPVGAFLPPRQSAIEADFKRELERRHGIAIDGVFTITNMPISRFLEFLIHSGNYERYMQRLVDTFNPDAAAAVMCRTMISVGWDGTLYDCDFNQMLDLPVDAAAGRSIHDLDLARHTGRRIVTGRHCFGCTAGCGSSCGGEIA
jgi:radical SAM/Cys-rich protein